MIYRRKAPYLIGRGALTSAVTANLVSKLLVLASKFKALDLFISSCGGEVTAGLTICQCMQALNIKVRTLCFGRAHSVASLVLASGRSGCRKAIRGSSISLHQPAVGCFGNSEEVAQQIGLAFHSETAVIQTYMKVCGKRFNEVRLAMRKAFAMDANAAQT